MATAADPREPARRDTPPVSAVPPSGPEAPRGGIDALRDRAYGFAVAGLEAWTGLRHRRRFAGVERFCLFVGYPRSGHSIVGALLNAHPDAVVAHELNVVPLVLAGCTRDDLYARILARATWFHLRGDRSNYDYRVPRQWQGRFRNLRVVGDKRGGAVTRCLGEHPDFLARLRNLVGIPLRLPHVVRNPFDNIAAISLWHRLSLEDSVSFYFDHCRTTARLDELCAPGELLTLRHEDLVAAPEERLIELCAFLGVAPEPGWVEDCCRIVFRAPTWSRNRVAWPATLRREVERRAGAHAFLAGYDFEEVARLR